MLAGHMDQIGFIASDITEEGFVKFSPIGGLIPFALISQRVIFENGTVGVLVPGSDFEKSGDVTKLKAEDLFIDIGCTTKEEAEKRLLREI